LHANLYGFRKLGLTTSGQRQERNLHDLGTRLATTEEITSAPHTHFALVAKTFFAKKIICSEKRTKEQDTTLRNPEGKKKKSDLQAIPTSGNSKERKRNYFRIQNEARRKT
jgi:hypothetical protein